MNFLKTLTAAIVLTSTLFAESGTWYVEYTPPFDDKNINLWTAEVQRLKNQCDIDSKIVFDQHFPEEAILIKVDGFKSENAAKHFRYQMQNCFNHHSSKLGVFEND